MRRETATQARDLAHEFADAADGGGAHNVCIICGAAALDALHVAWEEAAETSAAPTQPLPRERGA